MTHTVVMQIPRQFVLSVSRYASHKLTPIPDQEVIFTTWHESILAEQLFYD